MSFDAVAREKSIGTFLCLERHTNEVKGSIQSRIDLLASFACQTANDCDKS